LRKILIDFVFTKIDRKSKFSAEVDQYILEKIGHLYGTPEVNHWTRNKMWYGSDRITEVLVVEDKPVGILVYKTKLSNEYKEYGIENSLEMKSMFVFNVEKNGGLGYGSRLFKRILQVSREYNATSIHCTVSEEVPETMAFLKKKGFVVKGKFPIQYKKGFNEYLFQYNKTE
jgi:L-amino acid N-acyltransferase YncA